MATSAPSRANSTATARPMPESPPVISATLPSSLPAALYSGASYCGRGRSSASMPGFSCAGPGRAAWACGRGGRRASRLPFRGVHRSGWVSAFCCSGMAPPPCTTGGARGLPERLGRGSGAGGVGSSNGRARPPPRARSTFWKPRGSRPPRWARAPRKGSRSLLLDLVGSACPECTAQRRAGRQHAPAPPAAPAPAAWRGC